MPRHQICHQIFQKRFSQNPNDTNQIRHRHRHRPSFQLYYNHSILHHRYCNQGFIRQRRSFLSIPPMPPITQKQLAPQKHLPAAKPNIKKKHEKQSRYSAIISKDGREKRQHRR